MLQVACSKSKVDKVLLEIDYIRDTRYLHSDRYLATLNIENLSYNDAGTLLQGKLCMNVSQLSRPETCS